jgi:hypothetical protein
MSTKSAPRETDAEETDGHPAVTMAGVAAVPTVTDTWVTAMPHPDATKLSSLPKAVANAIDGKDHSNDPVFPDQGGQVLDITAAKANRSSEAK